MPSIIMFGAGSALGFGFGGSSSGGSSGPISLRATSTGTGTSGSSSFSVTAPAGVASGDFLVALLYDYNNELYNNTPPSGWTVLGTIQNSVGTTIMWKLAGGSEPASYTFTSNSGTTQFVGAYIAAYKNVTTGIDVHSTSVNQAGSGVSSETIPALTLNHAGMLIVLGGTYTGSTMSCTGGFTKELDTTIATNARIALFDQTSIAGSVGPFTISNTTGGFQMGYAINIY